MARSAKEYDEMDGSTEVIVTRKATTTSHELQYVCQLTNTRLEYLIQELRRNSSWENEMWRVEIIQDYIIEIKPPQDELGQAIHNARREVRKEIAKLRHVRRSPPT
jgi:hypothetical protein